jgi:hypothetical protein
MRLSAIRNPHVSRRSILRFILVRPGKVKDSLLVMPKPAGFQPGPVIQVRSGVGGRVPIAGIQSAVQPCQLPLPA